MMSDWEFMESLDFVHFRDLNTEEQVISIGMAD